jgi:hypothetical protein
MKAGNSESENVTPKLRQSSVPAIALATAICAFAIYAVVEAPATWRAAQRFKAEQIQQEDQMFCERFRMPPSSEGFATCVVYLTDIKRRHGDRLAAEAAGIL